MSTWASVSASSSSLPFSLISSHGLWPSGHGHWAKLTDFVLWSCYWCKLAVLSSVSCCHVDQWCLCFDHLSVSELFWQRC
jgi:hypothetical protein